MIQASSPQKKTQLRRAFLIGMLGGVVGGAAKLVGEVIIPPRKPGEEPPPALIAEKLLQRSLSKGQKLAATQFFHWTFSAGLGGIYSVLAEKFPQVTAGYVCCSVGWSCCRHMSPLCPLSACHPHLGIRARKRLLAN